MLELSLGTQNVDRRDTRFERQGRPLGVFSDVRHALEAHRQAANDLLNPAAATELRSCCRPEIFKRRLDAITAAVRRVIGRRLPIDQEASDICAPQ
jgi:hypothetical protein